MGYGGRHFTALGEFASCLPATTEEEVVRRQRLLMLLSTVAIVSADAAGRTVVH